jgi:hypothetical protein
MYGELDLGKRFPNDANHRKEHLIFMNFGVRNFTMK